jgi:RHS repeat-associated protein
VQIQGQILAQQESGAWVYVLPDHLGSVRQLVGSEGQVDLAQSFDPFGVPFEASGSGGSDFGYTGEWYGSYTELLFLRARYYDPGAGMFLNRDPVEGEPPYLYVRGNPVNCVDPSGLTPVPWQVGRSFMYSCRCGWIDWNHAHPRTDFIRRLHGAIDTASTNLVWFDDILEIPGSLVVIYKPAAKSIDNLNAIALGIYISASNVVEEVIQGGSRHPFHKQSSFSNEDLVSNLIGFHRGVDKYKGTEGMVEGDDETSKKYYMDLCGVVGYEYYKHGDKDEFIRIQKKVWKNMLGKAEIPVPFVGTHKTWGVRPPNQWSGSVEARDCRSHGCSGSDHLPSELISITPIPPQSLGEPLKTWAWVTTSLEPPPAPPSPVPYVRPSFPDFRDPDYLNSRPLSWGPSEP